MNQNPFQIADDLWRRLVEHQPAVAAAVAPQLRALPEDWSAREPGVTRPEAALTIASSGPEHRVEILPHETDVESCGACCEAEDDFCRYHKGVSAGYQMLGQPLLDAAKLDPDITVRTMLQRLAEAENAYESGAIEDAVDQLTKENTDG
ncbi:hypothetical protein [Streptomyces sp. NPDC053720]|uniref:hypothetical protein n=1 Tax=Streptomyces sp. NPDC053720 TaxID=3154855 RepID=UPI0034218B58